MEEWWNDSQYNVKNGMTYLVSFEVQLFVHNWSKLDSWILLQQTKPGYYVDSDGTVSNIKMKKKQDSKRSPES